jgi:2-polyprenyl-3-methyl-5-hydroxy-6-metoxy-1,4-benzoquinol methylase
MTTGNNYIISGGQEGKKRLHILAEALYPYTRPLLEKLGVSKGTSFLDAGCGGGDVSMMVAQMMGDNGSVTAIDFDKDIIALNKQEAADLGIQNISYETLSAYDISYSNNFDIAYARFLLSHLTEPSKALQKMAQSVKPGGKVVVEDIQFSGHFCHPACEAFNRYIEYFTTAAHSNGHNAEIGINLFSLFQQAGFHNIGFDVIQPVFNTGPGKWMAHITLDKISNTLIQQGIANNETIIQMLQELEAYTNDNNTIISLPRIFRVWGEKR